MILCLIVGKEIKQRSINVSDFWSQPKMSGFFQNNVRDPRSQDPDFLELWQKHQKLRENELNLVLKSFYFI